MNSIIYGFADICTSAFKLLPPIGAMVNWLFGITLLVGIVFWLRYDSSVDRGEKNFMADKGK